MTNDSLIKQVAVDAIMYIGKQIKHLNPAEGNLHKAILEVTATVASSILSSTSDAKDVDEFMRKLRVFMELFHKTTVENFRISLATNSKRTSKDSNVHYL